MKRKLPDYFAAMAAKQVGEEEEDNEDDVKESHSWLGKSVTVDTCYLSRSKVFDNRVLVIENIKTGIKYVQVTLTLMDGPQKKFIDKFDKDIAFSSRYTEAPKLVSIDINELRPSWRMPPGTMFGTSSLVPVDLKLVMPLAQALPPCPDQPYHYPLTLRDISRQHIEKAAIMAVLWRKLSYFHCDRKWTHYSLEQVVAVSCNNETYATKEIQKCTRVNQLRHQNRFLRAVCNGHYSIPAEKRSIGRAVLHEWQAVTAGRILDLIDACRNKDGKNETLAEIEDSVYIHGSEERVVVSVTLLQKQTIAILHAATGLGKTFVASVVALQKLVFVVAHPNSLVQWTTEASKVGCHATWIQDHRVLAERIASIEGDRDQMLIISHTMFRSRRLANTTMPTPDVIIVDEVHTPFASSVHRFMQKFPDVFKLGMTATLPDEVHQPIADLFAIDHRLIPAFTYKIPPVTNAAVYPAAKIEIEYISLTELERHSYNIVHQIGERAEQIRALLFPNRHEEDDSDDHSRRQREANETYVNKIWKDIMRKLTTANKKIHNKLVNIMLRCKHRHRIWDAIMNISGKHNYVKIRADVEAEPNPDTHDSAPETQRRLDAVAEEREALLGAYSYAAKVIVEASNVDTTPKIECSVCYDSTADYVMSAKCGHFLCTYCSKMVDECPICRARAAWRPIQAVKTDFAGLPQAVQTSQQKEMVPATSTKFARLAKLIRKENDGRMVIISPLTSLLPDIDTEMRKLGLNLVTLSGASAVLQGKLRKWRKGGSHGLLSGPEIPSLNLSEAKTLVFLSPLLTDTECIQSVGRVVRQGSFHKEVTIVWLAASNTIETETLQQRSRQFADIIQKISRGQISTE